jgi:hypothetical protein
MSERLLEEREYVVFTKLSFGVQSTVVVEWWQLRSFQTGPKLRKKSIPYAV